MLRQPLVRPSHPKVCGEKFWDYWGGIDLQDKRPLSHPANSVSLLKEKTLEHGTILQNY